MVRIVLKYTMYTQPYDKLQIAKTREKSEDHRVSGSDAASSIWNIVKMVLRAGVNNDAYMDNRGRATLYSREK